VGSYQVKVSGTRRHYEVKSVVEESHSRIRSPQAPLRLLSFDGGGIRGLSSLLILEELMKNVARLEKKSGRLDKNHHKPLKPYRYFDLIGG
jgi:patatin-like phospholipase/acyl hydrolase